MLSVERTCKWCPAAKISPAAAVAKSAPRRQPQNQQGALVPRPPTADPGERQRRFEVVYAAHRGPVLGYVLRRTGNPDDAADVIAETFLTAWRRLEEIPRDPQARLWLYGVA